MTAQHEHVVDMVKDVHGTLLVEAVEDTNVEGRRLVSELMEKGRYHRVGRFSEAIGSFPYLD